MPYHPRPLRPADHSRRPIARLRRAFLTGLVAIIPLAVTGYVVLVTLPGEIRLIGFITDKAPAQAVPELTLEGETVLAVYLPMSYQIGGYTLHLPERRLQRLALPVEEAMRMVLTASMNHPRTDNPAAQQTVTR